MIDGGMRRYRERRLKRSSEFKILCNYWERVPCQGPSAQAPWPEAASASIQPKASTILEKACLVSSRYVSLFAPSVWLCRMSDQRKPEEREEDDEDEELPLTPAQFERYEASLTAKAARLGLSRRNIRSIIYHVLSDPRTRNLLTQADAPALPIAKRTRGAKATSNIEHEEATLTESDWESASTSSSDDESNDSTSNNPQPTPASQCDSFFHASSLDLDVFLYR